MSDQKFLSTLAGIVYLIGYGPYILAIFRGTKPSKVSWSIWAALDVIVLVTMLKSHTVNGQIIGATAGSCIVAALALKRGEPGWTKFDKLCLSGAVFGIILWQMFRNPVYALLTSLGVAILASIPTFVSAWRDPSRESRAGWTIFFISCIFAICAIPQWTIADAAQPITFTAIECVMMYLLWIRPQTPRMLVVILSSSVQISKASKAGLETNIRVIVCGQCGTFCSEQDLKFMQSHTCGPQDPLTLN